MHQQSYCNIMVCSTQGYLVVWIRCLPDIDQYSVDHPSGLVGLICMYAQPHPLELWTVYIYKYCRLPFPRDARLRTSVTASFMSLIVSSLKCVPLLSPTHHQAWLFNDERPSGRARIALLQVGIAHTP